MGCGIGLQEETSKSYLNIATLSYEGSSISPFEYYSIDKFYKENRDEKSINKIFKKLLANTKINRQKLKEIDSKVKRQRYSPLYRKNCGIQKGVFETKEQFFKSWVKIFNTNVLSSMEQMSKKYGGQVDQNFLDKTLDDLRSFDYAVYESIVQYLYEIEDIQKVKSKMSVLKYCEFIQQFFNKPFLHEKKKIQSVIEFSRKKQIDVFIIPNCTVQLRLAFEKKTNYRILMSSKKQEFNMKDSNQQIKKQTGTMLLVNEKSFKKASDGRKGNRKFLQIFRDKHFESQKKKEFLQFSESVAVSIDNFIFIGVNLSSTTTEQQLRFSNERRNSQNRKQTLQLIDNLKVLKKYFPKKYIVLGGNMGIQVDPKYRDFEQGQQNIFLDENFYVFPSYTYTQPSLRKQLSMPNSGQQIDSILQERPEIKKHKYFTTMKKPTSMQLSFDDLEKNEIVECSDQIFYDKRIKIKEMKNYHLFNKTDRYTIDGKSFHSRGGQKFYMPNQIHPFSNLVIVKSVRVPSRVQKMHNVSQIKEEYRRQLVSSSSSDRSSKKEENEKLNTQNFNFHGTSHSKKFNESENMII